LPTDSPPERPNASAGRSGDDGNVRGAGDDADGDLWDKVSTFGVDVEGVGDAELERRAEAYLRRGENRLKGPAEACLGFDRGDAGDGDGDGDGRGVNRGGD